MTSFDHEGIPPPVLRNIEFFNSNKLWHFVTKNVAVRGCAEAARRRSRLGAIGIPLCDELKSSIGAVKTNGRQFWVVVHCRGHQMVAHRKLEVVLHGQFRRLSSEDLQNSFALSYGLVNPFAFADNTDVHHVVDRTVLAPFFPPFTMMTNLGDLRYGVEFDAGKLFGCLDRVRVADIVENDNAYIPVLPVIGILTGNSPESGILLWQTMNDRIRNARSVVFRGDLSFPRVLVDSVPQMGLSMELPHRNKEVRGVVLKAVSQLCEAGANVIALACNTTQYYSDEIRTICGFYGAQFVSIVDETAAYIRSEGITEFDFFGIGAVSDFTVWSDFRRVIDEFDVKLPTNQEISGIADLAFSVKRDVVSSQAINKLRDLISRSAKTDTVVLALTELSILFATQKSRQKSTRRFIDTLAVLADRLASIYLDERLKSGAT